MLETPILLLVYDRPHLTRRVFETVREQRPRHLFIVADGPRAGRPEDRKRCADTRAVLEAVDWPCEIHQSYAERNLGCRERVASGLTWFFDQVESGIVLEDDCLPHPSFFSFCERLLRDHASNEQVMHISGSNFQKGRVWGNGSYYFSSYPSVWGWASWRRAWSRYDLRMRDFPRFVRDKSVRERVASMWERIFWLGTFQMMHAQIVDTWDHAWTFAIWNHGGRAITANRNLVSNMGFGPEAAHTTRPNPDCIGLPLEDLSGAFAHPSKCDIAMEADRILLQSFLRFYGPRARARVLRHACGALLKHSRG